MAGKIRVGDTVEVLAGKDRGSQGKVISLDAEAKRVVVESVNIVKRHQKPTASQRQGGIIEKEAPIHLSNVSMVHRGEKTRVTFREVDGTKTRLSRKHDEAIDV